MSGILVIVQKHVEVEKEVTQEIRKWKHLMVVKSVLDFHPLPKAVTLKNVQVKHRVFKYVSFVIGCNSIFKGLSVVWK